MMCAISGEETFVRNVRWGWGLLMVGDVTWETVISF